ncbi:MAG: cytochrome c3 family protein [Gammaproteobacteria bacterium]|nr:cytochrome c3 family protein [Gammaproteobacteria bacterium]
MQQYRSAVFANLVFIVFVVGLGSVYAASLPSGRISDVRNTKHNLGALSSSGPARTVQSGSDEDEICVFCHTPHGANLAAPGPLWNRSLSTATYNTYNSGSLDATLEGVALDQPNGISKLCLSCHDGTIAIGAVNVLNGSLAAGPITMSGVQGDGTMPAGDSGVNSGFTRRLGTDLSNDHPISFTYDTALALKDGELRDPASEPEIGNRAPGVPRHIPLDNGQVQCNSCHDPHIRDEADPTKNIKFLRLNRFQKVSPISTTFNEANDIICMACHDKDGWVGSAHATDTVANETYTDAAADLREFPRGTAVWESACLTCHDTHTVQGSRRLLREGVDGPTGVSGEKLGGSAAIEETCFACHSSDGGTLTSQGLNTEVPDIKTDFNLTGTYATHMPLTNDEQVAGVEKHDIGTVHMDSQETGQRGKDFIESQASLGKVSMGGSLNNRHAECTDCHNPHRVTRRRLFNGDHLSGGLDSAGTHAHDISDLNAETPYSTHNNIASGVLRGTFGVEPVYSSNNFNIEPSSFTIKRGDPGTPGFGGGTTNVTEPYVTREYQICLKCHSNYAYDTPPALGLSSATTPSGINNMTQYTNQAREYNSPSSHKGRVSQGADGGADSSWNTNNHRSWHPVRDNTGRTAALRNADANNWLTPFNAAVGTQTMYCSDCHGSNTPTGTADPDGPGYENGNVWGPHGSTNPFLLKGDWSGNVPGSNRNDYTNRPGTGENTDSRDHLCFKCHDYDEYASTAGSGASGFGGDGMCGMGCMGGMGGSTNLHRFHISRITNFRCNLCHVAVPHGWKNKAFLVNLNDVGPEGGFGSTGNQLRNGTTSGYVNGPYYNRAALKVRSFAVSGNWQPTNCGSSGSPGNGASGVTWMANSSEACANMP